MPVMWWKFLSVQQFLYLYDSYVSNTAVDGKALQKCNIWSEVIIMLDQSEIALLIFTMSWTSHLQYHDWLGTRYYAVLILINITD